LQDCTGSEYDRTDAASPDNALKKTMRTDKRGGWPAADSARDHEAIVRRARAVSHIQNPNQTRVG